jgi:hypothetical protein
VRDRYFHVWSSLVPLISALSIGWRPYLIANHAEKTRIENLRASLSFAYGANPDQLVT